MDETTDHPSPHVALGLAEGREATGGHGFEGFCEEIASRLGVAGLDGDQDVDGYSLDYAHDYYRAGMRPAHAAATFRAIARRRADARCIR